MRSIMCMFALALIVIFSCCQKAPIEQIPEPTNGSVQARTTETVTVSVVSSSVTSNVLSVVFSGFENVNDVELSETQTLEFSTQNNDVDLSFQVLNTQILNNQLVASFDATGVNFSNLEIDGTQNVIIVDVSIE